MAKNIFVMYLFYLIWTCSLFCLMLIYYLFSSLARSSGVSARLSIANSPYEYDISGNLPNSVSRRSSGESSTNIGNVSAMMQKTNLGSQPNLVVPPVGNAVPPGVGTAGNSHQCAGFSNNMGNRCYNERLARSVGHFLMN